MVTTTLSGRGGAGAFPQIGIPIPREPLPMTPEPRPAEEPGIPVAIPADDDADGDLKLLLQADPDVGRHLIEEIGEIREQIFGRTVLMDAFGREVVHDGVVERARNHRGMTIQQVASEAATQFHAIERRELLLDRLAPEQRPQRPTLAEQLLALLRAIPRFADDQALREVRTSLVQGLRAKLAGIAGAESGTDEDLTRAVRDHHKVWQRDLKKEQAPAELLRLRRDGRFRFLDRVRGRLTERVDVTRRLTAMKGGRAAIACLMADAVARAGGPESVAGSFAFGMPAPDEAAPHRAELRRIEGNLAAADPASFRAGDLTAEREDALRQVAEAEARTAERKQAAALAIVAAAMQGDLKAVKDLEGRTPDAALVAACRLARGDDRALTATCQELIHQWEEKSR
jgi:hypothetical protein